MMMAERSATAADGSGGQSASSAKLDHAAEFERAWADPRHTRFERPPIDVNRVLAEHYRTSKVLRFTRAMLWDLEVRQAWRPDLYTPGTVRRGSARSWGHHPAIDGTQSLTRASRQRNWLEQDEYGLVLQLVRLDPGQQKVTLIGAAALPDYGGNLLRAGTGQILFNVEHAVAGSETQPLSRWRIVYLSDRPNEVLQARLGRIANASPLPEWVEIYARDNLKLSLTNLL